MKEILDTIIDQQEQLRKAIDLLQDSAVRVESEAIRRDATAKAALSLITELAMRLGSSPETLNEVIDLRIAHFHDEIIRNGVGQDSSLAARVDDREIEEIPTEHGFPLLFPRQ